MKSINNRQMDIVWLDSVMILKADTICVIVDLDDDKVALYPSVGISSPSSLREAVYLAESLILCSRTVREIKGSGIPPGYFRARNDCNKFRRRRATFSTGVRVGGCRILLRYWFETSRKRPFGARAGLDLNSLVQSRHVLTIPFSYTLYL
jgi:hypothetical protein